MDQVIASFQRSIPKTLALTVLSALLTLSGALMALGIFSNRSLGLEAKLAAYVGTLVFSLMTVAFLVELFRAGPVVEVTTSGIRDRRQCPNLISWTEISDVSVLRGGRRPCLTLRLRPEARTKLKPTRTARFAAKMNELGFPDMSISMRLLNGSLDDLVEAVERARAAA
jgi:hypothetical protein